MTSDPTPEQLDPAGVGGGGDRELKAMRLKPYDDCECVICTTLRNPPPPTEMAKALWAKYKHHFANPDDQPPETPA